MLGPNPPDVPGPTVPGPTQPPPPIGPFIPPKPKTKKFIPWKFKLYFAIFLVILLCFIVSLFK